MATVVKNEGQQPYTVRLRLDRMRGRQAPPRSFDLAIDRGKTSAVEVVDLSFSDSDVVTCKGRHVVPASDILARFGAGVEVDVEEALAIGRLLLQRLLPSEGVRRVWYEALASADDQGRPLRLELCLPRGDLAEVADLPFELLAGDEGFFFRRYGWTVVRTLAGVTSRTWTVCAGHRAGLAWANPQLNHGSQVVRLEEHVFQAHDAALDAHCRSLGLVKVDSCCEATCTGFKQWLEKERPVHVLSLVAHGNQRGGEVWLHADNHPQYPEDPGQPLSARDLAQLLRRADTQVALLWSCHGGVQHGVQGAVAEALIETGNLAAVVASHAALRAEATGRMAEALLSAVHGTAEGDLERAVTEARIALAEDDVQWAAPVYYARPFHDRSVWTEFIEESFDLPPEPAGPQQLIGVPPAVPHFRGRHDELGRVMAILRNNRLVSIVGMPGIGKSEIARRVVDDAMSDERLHLDTTVWIDITDHETLELIAARIGRAFGIDRWDDERALDKRALANAIGQRRALLVLDNAEDLLRSDPIGPPDFFGYLMQECAGLRLLLSSRRTLGEARGFREHALEIGCLPFDDAREAFVAAAGARLRVEDRDSEGLSELVRALDGHPRSLYLVAGQVGRDLTLGELRRRIIERDRETAILADELLDLDVPLTDDTKQDQLLRARRLVSSLNLAWAPLWQHRPEAAETLAWLGTLPAGLPGPLIPLVFGEEGASRVRILRRQYMVEVRHPDQTAILPAPLRWYAEKQVGRISASRQKELLAATVRALGAWLGAAERAVGRGREGRAIGRATTQTANLAAIVDRWPAASDTRAASEETELALSQALSNTLHTLTFWGQPSVGVGLATQVEAFAATLSNAGARATSWKAIGDLYEGIYRRVDAERCYEQALASYRELGDRLGEANTLHAQGAMHALADRLVEAERCYGQALPLYRDMVEQVGEANTLQAQGDLYKRVDRLLEAARCYEQALQLYRQIGDRRGEANTLRAQGDLYTRVDRLVEAERCYERALPLYREIEARRGEANTLWAQGGMYARASRLVEAQRCYEQALPLYREIEDRQGEANTLRAQGQTYAWASRFVEAQRCYDQALLLYRAIEARLGEANTLQAQGDLHTRLRRLAEAERCYGQALPLYRHIGDRLGEANTVRAQGDLYKRMSRLVEAERCYEEALPLYREIEARQGEANTLKAHGDLYARVDRLLEAQRCYEQALSQYREIEDRLGEANTLKGHGDLYQRVDRLAEAQSCYEQALPLHREIGDRQGEAHTLRAQGDLYARVDKLLEADLCYEQALQPYRQIGDRHGEAMTLWAQGQARERMSRLAEAERCYEQALPLFREIEDRLGEANTLQSIAALRTAQKRPAEGWRLLRTALQIQVRVGDELGIGGTLGNLVRTAVTIREFDRALCLGGPNRVRFQRIGNRWGEMLTLTDIAKAAASRNDDRLVVSALVLAWIVAEAIEDPSAEERAKQLAVMLALDLSDGPPEGLAEEAEALLAAGVDAATRRLADAGIDPLSDLEEP